MPTINPAHQFLQMSRNEVGSYALDIANLASHNIPLPQSFCIPSSTLKLIAQHNHLDKKFEQLLKTINKKNHHEIEKLIATIQKMIVEQAIPDQVSHKLIELYTSQLNHDFVRLTSSPTDGNPVDYKREDKIKGEANMMQSILRLWAKNIDPKDIQRENLTPIAVLVQSQKQPTSSGYAFSLNINNGDKSVITIQSVYGVFDSNESMSKCDRFYVDKRSWKLQNKKIADKKLALRRVPDGLESFPVNSSLQKKSSLTPQQIKKIAKIVNHIKLLFPHQILVHFELVNGEMIITKIKPYYPSPNHNQNEKNSRYQILLIGQSLTSGYINGQCRLIHNEKDLDLVKPGEIGVIKNLNDNHQKLIQLCSGIICEEGVKSKELLNKIRHYQLPTMIYAKHALSKLNNQQQITLDASAGKVYSSKTKNDTEYLDQPTKLQVLLSINHSNEISTRFSRITDGVGMLRSEHQFVKANKHPKQIFNSAQDEFVQQASHNLVKLYHRFSDLGKKTPIVTYRSLNLHTNQLHKLRGGESYEQPEINPLLGFRGGIRLINQPWLLELELSILNKANRKIDVPINYMLPFIRTSFELQRLWKMIEQKSKSVVYQPPIWLQLNTPENLINIKSYLQLPIAAICINIKSIHALLHGFDPDFEDLRSQYPVDQPLIENLLKKLVSTAHQCTNNLKVYIMVSDYNQQLLDFAIKYEINGIITYNRFAAQYKKKILKASAALSANCADQHCAKSNISNTSP